MSQIKKVSELDLSPEKEIPEPQTTAAVGVVCLMALALESVLTCLKHLVFNILEKKGEPLVPGSFFHRGMRLLEITRLTEHDEVIKVAFIVIIGCLLLSFMLGIYGLVSVLILVREQSNSTRETSERAHFNYSFL